MEQIGDAQVSQGEQETMAKLPTAFHPLERLVGSWKLHGRTLDTEADNIFGETTVRPILNATYLQRRDHMRLKDDVAFESLEIVRYDPERHVFSSAAYTSKGDGPGDAPTPYEWVVEADGTVIHHGTGATYRGRFSDDDQELVGVWRPDAGETATDESAYDLTMTRV